MLLALILTTSVLRAGGVYWSDRGASRLYRMGFDGTNLQAIGLSGTVTSPGSNVRGIAIDVESNLVFWADNGTDRLLRANLDGTSSMVLYAITGGNSFPADVRPDRTHGLLYWCDQLRNRIQRSTYAGAAVQTVISNGAPTGPYFMDLDSSAGKIYWGDFDGGMIYRANLDGSSRETLLTGNNRTRGVKVDPGEGMLYWINRDDKKVHRCPLWAFTNGTIQLTNPLVQTLYTGLDTPHGLELDIPARKLYWADTGGNNVGGAGAKAVSRGDFDGGSPMEILATGSEPWDVDLDRRCGSYAEWRTRCFRRDAPAAQTDPAADPDGDGIPNATEYALDSCPLFAGGSVLPSALLVAGPEPNALYPALVFCRRSGSSDLAYYAQTSTNLLDWRGSPTEPQTTEIQVTRLADDLEEVTARTLEPVSSRPVLFLRLRVELLRESALASPSAGLSRPGSGLIASRSR